MALFQGPAAKDSGDLSELCTATIDLTVHYPSTACLIAGLCLIASQHGFYGVLGNTQKNDAFSFALRCKAKPADDLVLYWKSPEELSAGLAEMILVLEKRGKDWSYDIKALTKALEGLDSRS